MDEYGEELVKLGERLMRILSSNLGVNEEQLQEAFGGEDFGACMRVNYYPKCPRPELALGLSPHSDPGGITILLPDDQVAGLQVRHGDMWITVNALPNAFVVNLGDQMQVTLFFLLLLLEVYVFFFIFGGFVFICLFPFIYKPQYVLRKTK